MTCAALLTFGERGGLISAAIALRSGSTALSAGLALGASACFLVARVVERSVRANVERRLLVAFARASLEGDTLVGTAEEQHRTFIDGLEATQSTVARDRPQALANAAALIVGVVALALTQTTATLLIAIGALVVSGTALFAFRRTLAHRQRAHHAAVQRAYREFLPLLSGRHDIAMAGASERSLTRLAERAEESRQVGRRAALVSAATGRVPGLVVLGIVAIVMRGFGVDVVELPIIAACLLPFSGVVLALIGLSRARVPLAALRTWLDVPAPTRGGETPVDGGMIRLRDATIAYPGTPEPALMHVTLSLDAPCLVAVTGANGSGKSTLLRAIVGAIPGVGDVFVDERPLTKVDIVAWRRMVAFMPQKPFLTGGSAVVDAVQLFEEVNPAKVREVLVETGAWEVLAAKRPDEPLSVLVDELSGGERQRVALARALAREAKVILLDEPEASLDSQGVHELAQALRRRAESALVVIAAHGPELLRIADRVIHLERGRLISDERRVTPPSLPDNPRSPVVATTAES